MNKKGFTLVELLVTMVIIGIITGISIPLIRNISASMTMRKYKLYSNVVLNSGKLYNDAYADDLFGRKKAGCYYVKYSELEEKKLLKDIDMTNISCNSDETYVKIVKYENKYYYSPYLGCGNITKDGKFKVTMLYPKKREAQESCDVDSQSIMDIEADPVSANSVNKSIGIKTSIVTNTGISLDYRPKIKYGFTRTILDDKKTKPTIITGTVWKNLKFPTDLPSKREQEELIMNAKEQKIAASKIYTPHKVYGKMYLVVEVDTLKDLSNNDWQTNLEKYKYFGPYTVVEQPYTLKYDDNGGSGCSSKSITKKEGEAWGTLCTPTKPGYIFVGWKNGSEAITATSKATKNITVKAEWKLKNITVYYNLNGGFYGTDVKVLFQPQKYYYRNSPGFWKLNYKPQDGNLILDKVDNNVAGNHPIEYLRSYVPHAYMTEDIRNKKVGPKVWDRNNQLTLSFNASAEGNQYIDVDFYNLRHSSDYYGDRILGQIYPLITSTESTTNWFIPKEDLGYGQSPSSINTINLRFFYDLDYSSFRYNVRIRDITIYDCPRNDCKDTTFARSITFKNKYGLPKADTIDFRRAGYIFTGWYTQATGGTKVTADTILTNPENHTLYAHWARQ